MNSWKFRPTTRPLINKQNNDGFKVETPRQITLQFDQIAYAKGGSILRMMQHVMTEAVWVDGMRPYLNQNKVSSWFSKIKNLMLF